MQCVSRITMSLMNHIKRLCAACLWVIAFVLGGVFLVLVVSLLLTLTVYSRPTGYSDVMRLEQGVAYAAVKAKILDRHKWDRTRLYYEPDIYKRLCADNAVCRHRQGFIVEATRNRGFSNGDNVRFVFDDCNRLVWAEVRGEFAYNPRWAKQGPVVLPRLECETIFPLYAIDDISDRHEIKEGGARFVRTVILHRNKNATAFPVRLTDKPALVVENGKVPSGAVRVVRCPTSDAECVRYDIELDGEFHAVEGARLKVVIKYLLPNGMSPIEYDFDLNSVVGQKY